MGYDNTPEKRGPRIGVLIYPPHHDKEPAPVRSLNLCRCCRSTVNVLRGLCQTCTSLKGVKLIIRDLNTVNRFALCRGTALLARRYTNQFGSFRGDSLRLPKPQRMEDVIQSSLPRVEQFLLSGTRAEVLAKNFRQETP
jgi:hypothetical protein